jgi:hypothetical protein
MRGPDVIRHAADRQVCAAEALRPAAGYLSRQLAAESHIAYFHVVESRCSRQAPKLASVRFAKKIFQAPPKLARASSNVAAVPADFTGA